MLITELELQNFRNYEKQKIERNSHAGRYAEGIRKAAEYFRESLRKGPENIHIDEQGKHRQDHENHIDGLPDKAYNQLAPDMGRG